MQAHRLALLCGALLAACADDDGAKVECGEGTEEKNGACVPVLDNQTSCGGGTVLDDQTGECVPEATCGAGTVADPLSGLCVPAIECGLGTVLDPTSNTCVPEQVCGAGTVNVDGACVPVATCGDNTVLVNGECVVPEPCVGGATYDDTTGTCISLLECGPDQIDLGGECTGETFVLAAGADLVEPLVDLNDPALGGTPEPLALEAAPGRTIFRGALDRPTDFDANGVLDQDLDVWRFSATAGTYLRIQVLTLGLPQPAFVLTGPNGYRRESAAGYTLQADREVVLPYAGDYDLTIVPAVYLLAGLPVGGVEAGYVGVIDALTWPTPAAVTPEAGFPPASPVAVTLTSLADNFLSVSPAVDLALEINVASAAPQTTPAILVFNGAGELVADYLFDFTAGPWTGALVEGGDTATIIVDWVSSRAVADDVSLHFVDVPLVELGTSVADVEVISPAASNVLPGATVAYRFDNPVARVTTLDFNGNNNPDVQIVRPVVRPLAYYDSATPFFLTEAGSHIAFVKNDGTTTVVTATVEVLTEAAVDLGVLAPGNGANVSGEVLEFMGNAWQRVWTVVRLEDAALVSAVLSSDNGGDPTLFGYSPEGVLLRTSVNPRLSRIVDFSAPPGNLLLQLSSVRPLLDWSLDVDVSALPETLDVEQNDSYLDAHVLPALPAVVAGRLEDADLDFFVFALDAPLPATQAIEVQWSNLEVTDTSSPSLDGAAINVYDAAFTPLPSIPYLAPTTSTVNGVSGNNAALYISAAEGQGPFYIELGDNTISTGESWPYVLRVRLVDLSVEAEPNNDPGTATAIPFPSTVVGYRAPTADDAADLFTFTLANPIPAGSSLRVSVANLEDSNGITWTLEDGANVVLATVNRLYGRTFIPAAAAGTYFVRLAGSMTTRPPYRVSVEVGPRVENNPLNTASETMALGALDATTPLVVDGFITTAGIDVYTVDVPAPLAAGESVQARMYVLTPGATSNVTVELFDGTTAAPRLTRDIGTANTLIDASPGAGSFSLRLTGSSTTPYEYRLFVEVAGRGEAEPNSLYTTANNLGTLPVSLRGNIDSTTADPDFFAVTLPADLAAGEVLAATVQNLVDTTTIGLELRGTDGTTVLQTQQLTRSEVRSAAALPAGTYYLRVFETTTTSNNASDLYQLDVRVEAE